MPLSRDQYATVRTYYGSDDKFPFILVTYWYSGVDSTDAQGDAQAMIDAFATRAHAAMMDCLCGEAYIFGSAISYNVLDVIYTASTGGAAVAGNVAGDESPDYAAAVIRKRTGSPGRSGYGRWFVGGVPELFTDTSSINPTGLPFYDTFSSSLIDDLVTGGPTWEAQHYSHKNDAYSAIVASHVDRYLGTQKRRQVRLPF